MWMTSLHCCHRVHRKSIYKSNFQNEFLALLWWISVVIGIKMKLDCISILKELFNVCIVSKGLLYEQLIHYNSPSNEMIQG